MKKYIKRIIIVLILILTILIIAFYTSKLLKPFYKVNSRISELKKESKTNPATVGWIKVQGTDIDYPIVKNENYTADINKVIDRIWRSDYYIKGKNRMVVYGHNYLNVGSKPLITNKAHKRFEQLLSFTYYKFAKDNLYIQYSHDNKDEIYKIYAISFLNYNEDDGKCYDKKDVNEYIKNAKKISIYNYDVDVDDSDKIIALMTCTRYFGADEKQQFRIDARKLRKNEKIEKYSVEKSKNYDIMK